MKIHKIAEEGNHAWYFIGREEGRSEKVIDTNEYVIISDGEAVLVDPGGTEVFPFAVSAVSQITPVKNIKHFFCSHQDPDVFSSLPLWLGLCPTANIYMSWVWSSFIAHYGHEYVDRFVTVDDAGIKIVLENRRELVMIPAHYLHSSGNFHLYDPVLKILFTGDIGAALLPSGYSDVFVQNFEQHIQYIEGFHRRWMPSNQAKRNWIQRVRELDIKYMCPQHGAIYQGQDVQKFLDWFDALEVGSAVN